MMNYRHTLQIELDTQFKKTTPEDLEEQVKLMLGPWCADAKVVRLNEELGQ